MPLRLYTDSHIAKAVAIQLRTHGVDAIHCEEVGMSYATDEVHLAYAVREKRSVVTFDQDFPRIDSVWHEQGKSHYGIFYITGIKQNAIGEIVKSLLFYHEAVQQGATTLENDINDRVIFVP